MKKFIQDRRPGFEDRQVISAEFAEALRVQFSGVDVYAALAGYGATWAEISENVKKDPETADTFTGLYLAGYWGFSGLIEYLKRIPA